MTTKKPTVSTPTPPAADTPIKVDLQQVRPKRSASTKKPKAKVVVDNTAELKATIDRIFADEDCVLITTQSQLEEFLSLSQTFGLDTETTGLRFFADKIAGFSLGTATKSAYIPLQHTAGQNYQDDIEAMIDLMLQKDYYGFNAQFDWHFLQRFNKRFRNLKLKGEGSVALRCYDIRLPHELKPAYKAVIDPDYEEYSFNKLFKNCSFIDCDPVIVYKYAAVDARKHYVLTEYFESKLKELPDIWYRYQNLELKVLKPVYETEEYGFCIDENQINYLYNKLEAQKGPILQTIREIVGNDTFNPGSPTQVKSVFAGYGIKLKSTDESTLEKINHPLAKAILEYRGVIKLQGTYTTNLLQFTEVIDNYRVIHTGFNTIGAETSRMSSKNPNMQNIPRDNEYRAMFIARPGRSLCSVDYSQQEVRILAALAGDETMIDAFNSGKDFYALMASIVFKLPYEECGKHGVNGAKRNQMKSVVLGLNYSMGIKSLASDLGTTEAEANEIITAFYKACPKVHAFQDYCLQFARTHGYNETLLKHRRYYTGLGYQAQGLPRFEAFGPGLQNTTITAEDVIQRCYDLKNSRTKLNQFIDDLAAPGKKKETKNQAIYVRDREMYAFNEERQTTNSVVQGTAAEMTKLAAIAAQDDEELHRLDAHIVNYIHDEMIIEAPDENIKEAGDRLAYIMNDVSLSLVGVSGGAVPDIFKVWVKE